MSGDLTVRLRRGFGGLVPPVCDEAANTIEELRELNAELVRQLRTCADMFEGMDYKRVALVIRETIAKSEKLK